MRSDQTVDAYFQDLQDITERLAAINSAVSADFQIAVLLRGLPPGYESLGLDRIRNNFAIHSTSSPIAYLILELACPVSARESKVRSKN